MAMRRQPRTEAVDLEFGKDSTLRNRVYAGTFAAFLLVGAVGGWAANAELSGAIVAQGQVKVDKDLRAIQHLDGGIIREIAVKKGDTIVEGQLLFRLDSTQTKAELQIIESQLTELLAKQVRLIAERDGLALMPAPRDPLNLGVNASDAMKGELRLFQGNFKSRESQKKQLELSISQLDHEIGGLEAQAAANRSELTLVEAELKKVEELQKKGLIEYSRVYGSTRDRTRLLGEKGNVEANIARSGERRSELSVNRLSIDETARNEAQKVLSELEPRISELEQRHNAITDRLSRTEIRSPMGGTINEIAVNTIGGVITPAQKLLTVVPENAKLQIEVKLQPSDIDQVFVGQETKLRFSAFAANNTPELYGIVAFVSPATTSDSNTGQVYYVAQVDVSDSEYAKLAGKKLLPGMPVEAYVQTESRTAFTYLAKPFTDQFTKAFREQ
jgi:HlyD family type I secretion membrane fusion protein